MTVHTKNPGKRFMTKNGNMCVNFHNVFFFMDRFGNYLPWSQTLHHGKLLPQQEWVRLRNEAGGSSAVKELTPCLEERARSIAEALQKDPFYKMTAAEKETAIKNRENYLGAQAEGVSVEEYLRRQEIRRQRAEEKATKKASAVVKTLIPVKKDETGRSSFLLSHVPGFSELTKKIASL